MKKNYILTASAGVVFLLFSIIGCSKVQIQPQKVQKTSIEDNLIYAFEDYSLPLSAAKAKAKFIQPKTRSGKSAKIQEVSYITSVNPNSIMTKSGGSVQQDTVMYVINYENDGGFVILAADYRVDPIVAMSESGSFDTKNLNETIEFVMDRAKSSYWEQIAEFDKKKDELGETEINRLKNKYKNLTLYNKSQARSVVGGGEGSLPPEPCDTIDRPDTEGEVVLPDPPSPYITNDSIQKNIGLYTKYDQGHPFNKYAPSVSGGLAVAGCGPVAIGQVMAFHGHPAVLKGRPLRWSIMNSPYVTSDPAAIDDVAYLLRKIGDDSWIDWGVSSTGIWLPGVGPTLNNYGYKMNTGYWTSDEPIITSIDNNLPILCSGDDPIKGGHLWVIYGYKKVFSSTYYWYWDYELKEYLLSGNPFKRQTSFQVLCNWGWGGSGDTWFTKSFLKPFEDDELHFSEDLYLISSIRPK